MKKLFTAVLALYALSAPFSAQADTIKRKICVFDIVGNVGPVMNAMKDWKAAAMEWGLETELVPYTNEAIAAEDLKAGICDASLITGIRGRAFNKYAGTVDSIGAIPTMDHMKVVLQVLSNPKSADKLSQGAYQILGIAPAGAAYIFVNDRQVNSLAKAAGKKVAVLEYDETQAKLVSQVGATPVASDITNFSTKFNNGVVDVIAAPLVAYSALELYKGLSPDGGIINYPLVQLTFQLIAKNDRFPPEMAQKSREYFYNNLHRMTDQLDKEARHVDPRWWVEIPEEDKAEYEVLMQEARDQLRVEGYYDPNMLTLLRKVRCKMEPSRAECT
ncbi:putative solute-binding protein [Alcanivorax sp.]|jgi:TRAP-type C4-dicarboxylate transport system substrate-binding protein|uniref:putative solute-binding protein n=1 Tax=Alcanivorax sp. TaxID=1872427 RepID=UPI0032D8E019